MARIKVKHPNPREPETRTKLLETLSKHQIFATKIVPLDDSLIVLTSDTIEAEKIFGSTCNSELLKQNFAPILPPEIKARRTIILTRIDDYIYNNSEEEIKEELAQNNSWIEDGITEIYKFPKSNTLKITYNQQEKASKSTNNGLLMYHMRVPPHQIKQEEYVNLQTCMKCYKLEDHHTNQCPQNPDFKICSECGTEGHQYRTCNNQIKKCINCGGPHRTLAMKCPIRKKAIQDKRMIKTNTDITYSKVAQQPIMQHQPTQIDKDMPAKILSCMLHAHLMNVGNPGTYEKVLTQTLTLNNLPAIKIPEVPQSAKILNLARTNDINTEPDIGATQLEGKRKDPRLEPQDKRERSRNNTSEEESLTIMEDQPETADEIGLKILLTSKSILPTRDPHIEHIVAQINNGEYKWTYTDTRFDDSTVASWISQRRIKITKNDFKKLDEGTFRKIRNGLNQRSPPKEQRNPKKVC